MVSRSPPAQGRPELHRAVVGEPCAAAKATDSGCPLAFSVPERKRARHLDDLRAGNGEFPRDGLQIPSEMSLWTAVAVLFAEKQRSCYLSVASRYRAGITSRRAQHPNRVCNPAGVQATSQDLQGLPQRTVYDTTCLSRASEDLREPDVAKMQCRPKKRITWRFFYQKRLNWCFKSIKSDGNCSFIRG